MAVEQLSIVLSGCLAVLIGTAAWAARFAWKLERETKQHENRRLLIEQIRAEDLADEVELWLMGQTGENA